jgi:hypothetical protein
MGSAAFLAPEMSTSPSSATPPSMISLSTASSARPFFGRQRFHRQRVDFLAHALAQRAVHELVLAHLGQAPELRAHDDRLEVAAVACDFDVIALQSLFDALLDEIGIHENL